VVALRGVFSHERQVIRGGEGPFLVGNGTWARLSVRHAVMLSLMSRVHNTL
jgi:hypothetical protein